MSSIRRVRRDFRKEVLRLVNSGDGNIQKLIELAGRFFGHLVGYEVLIKTFLQTEVSYALSQLRSEGTVETIGKQWKPTSALQPEDIEVISVRRLKRVRGELKEQMRVAHAHGRFEEAAMVGAMLSLVTQRLKSNDVHAEQETQDVHAAQPEG